MEGRRSRNRKSAKRRRAQSSERNRDAKKGKSEPSSSSFLEKMKARLSGGHFRMINEKLYTCTGEEALNYFKEDPSLFNMYHAGYQAQMSQWPEQPVHKIIEWLQVHSPSLIVADFGCGDARVAKSVKNKVFSFDLVSNDPDVIAGDMSNRCVLWIRFGHHFPLYTNISLLRTIQTTYLDSSSVDVAIFCLSLMGINYPNYVREAHRVLKPSGWLLIAEVKSRLDPKTGGADPNKFIKAVCELGFTPLSKDFTNKMFVLFHFTKQEKPSSKREEITWPELKPCIYKRR